MCIDLSTFLSGSLPGWNILVIILEGAIADEFGIETAVGSMVDILEEDAIEVRRYLDTWVRASTLMVTCALAAKAEASTAESKICLFLFICLFLGLFFILLLVICW